MHGDINDNLDSVEQRDYSTSSMLDRAESEENGIVTDIHADVKENAYASESQSSSIMKIDNSSNPSMISDDDVAESW